MSRGYDDTPNRIEAGRRWIPCPQLADQPCRYDVIHMTLPSGPFEIHSAGLHFTISTRAHKQANLDHDFWLYFTDCPSCQALVASLLREWDQRTRMRDLQN
jgi:hypothetical protein